VGGIRQSVADFDPRPRRQIERLALQDVGHRTERVEPYVEARGGIAWRNGDHELRTLAVS